MKELKVEITGIVPILLRKMDAETQVEIGTGAGGGRKTPDQHREQARKLIYRNEQGLYLPGRNIKKAIISTASALSLKYGKKSLKPFLEALLFIDPREINFFRIDGKKEHYYSAEDYIDEQSGRIPPRTGARVMIYRAALKEGWKLRFSIQLVDERIPLEHIKKAMEEAGILNGMGDNRPEYGRFTVKWLD